MREILYPNIVSEVARLAHEANNFLSDDVLRALRRARENEESAVGREILDQILTNAQIAADERVPLCQDCGLAVVFVELGQDAHITGGHLYDAINEGIRQGYEVGYLRKSVVQRPYTARINTRDNTPAVIHTDVVPGDELRITVLPKGGGCENMSYLKMLPPAAGRQGVVDFIVESVDRSGANPCPPVIIGVGIGGTADKAMGMAKHALLREVGAPSSDPENAELEAELLERINNLGIGPMGLGGRITALAVHVESAPAHIASLPVAVNTQCHSARWKSVVL
jgi:fumarate hydratase subunit alpha